jgi:hypothetical protein
METDSPPLDKIPSQMNPVRAKLIYRINEMGHKPLAH